MLCNADDSAGWSVCMRLACNAACCDPAQFVVLCLNFVGGDVQQHFALLMCSTVPCNTDDSAA